MSRRHPFADVEREILADLAPCRVDPARVPEFTDAFSHAVFEAADTAALLIGSLPPAELPAAVERIARIVVDAIDTAADQTGNAAHPWIVEAQRWAVGAFFARLAEVSQAAFQGGRA